jgi:hypothetical protein
MSARDVGHADWEQEQPDLDRRIITLGARVLSVSMVFFFGGFFFAFVYLRLQNVNGRWNQSDAKPSLAWSILVLACAIGAAVALLTGRRHARAETAIAWRARGAVALALVSIAIVARFVLLWTLPVAPDKSSYVSVLIGWSAALLVVELGAWYWIETLVARAGRLARTDTVGDAEAAAQAEQRFAGSAAGITTWWSVLAAIEIVALVLLVWVR